MNAQLMQLLIALGQLGLGKLVKSHPGIENKYIPVFTFLAAVLGYSLTPTTGQVDPTAVAVASIVSTAVVTGTHSIGKNFILPILEVPLKGIAGLFGFVKKVV